MINIKEKLDISCDFPTFFNMFFSTNAFTTSFRKRVLQY